MFRIQVSLFGKVGYIVMCLIVIYCSIQEESIVLIGRLVVLILAGVFYHFLSVVHILREGILIRRVVYIKKTWVRKIEYESKCNKDDLILILFFCNLRIRVPLNTEKRENLITSIKSLLEN